MMYTIDCVEARYSRLFVTKNLALSFLRLISMFPPRHATVQVTQSNQDAGGAVWRSHVAVNAILASGVPTAAQIVDQATQDVLNALVDSITRYHPVLSAAMTKDEALGGTRDEVTLVVLQQLFGRVSGNRMYFSTLLQLLVEKTETLSVLSVIKFIVESSSTTSSVASTNGPDWQVASESVRHFADTGIMEAMTKYEEEQEDQMMDHDYNNNDGGNANGASIKASAEVVDKLTAHLAMLSECLEYAANHVTAGASSLTEVEGAKGKVSPQSLNFVEGFRGLFLQIQLCLTDVMAVLLSLSQSTVSAKGVGSVIASSSIQISELLKNDLGQKSTMSTSLKLLSDVASSLQQRSSVYIA
jgi:hypothetical protein